jgi:Family of unknown function (DUF5691)
MTEPSNSPRPATPNTDESRARGSSWTALVDAAVVGTGRAPPPPVPPVLATLSGPATELGPAEVGPAANGTAPEDAGALAAAGLLHAAAAASRARRAGLQPADAADVAPPPPAPADGRPEVSAAATRRLSDLLAADRTDLVLEWLRMLAPTGCRPPDALVPVLLAAAGGSRDLRAAVTPLVGPLAGWLAAANPEWAWIAALGSAGQADPAAWPTSSHRERRALLESLRRTDPAAARDLVVSTWETDTARDRTAFIVALGTGLGPDDEEVLERALADNRAEVRLAAAGLLARLPGSRFSGRAADRAAAAVLVRRSLTGRKLVATAPDEATPDMLADCIDPSLPRATGRRSWLLRQIVAAAPAAWWPAHTGLAPPELLALAAGTEWATALEFGWTDGAIRDADPAWLTALLARRADRAVFQALPVADREDWLRRHPDSPLFAALDLVPGPWSAGLSEVVCARLRSLATIDPRQSPETRRLLRLAALRLEPDAAPRLVPDLVHSRLLDSWAEMLTTLSIRAAMYRELNQERRR